MTILRRSVPARASRRRARVDLCVGRHLNVGRLSGGPVPGVGGLTTLALVFHVAVVSPQFLWLPVASLVAGSLLSIALIVRHQRQPYPTPTDRSLGLSVRSTSSPSVRLGSTAR